MPNKAKSKVEKKGRLASAAKADKKSRGKPGASRTPPATQGPGGPAWRESDFLFVGIGASAGGLDALKQFLKGLRDTAGMAFVLVQHQSPQADKDLLGPLLASSTGMRVLSAEDGRQVEPQTLHLVPPGYHMGVFKGRLQLFPDEPAGRERMPIDFFFRSLAEDQGSKAVAIVLSGADTDGTLGVKAVKGNGGMVMAQSPESAEFDLMPRSAAEFADWVLPPAALAERLMQFARSAAKPLPPGGGERPEGALKTDLEKILMLVRSHTGQDFFHYKRNTIERRIKRRMDIHQIRSLSRYVAYLTSNPKELHELFRDLLIGVTSFFRDPEAFDALQQALAKDSLPRLGQGETFRAWVAGCSTGEEAYSLAIVLAECLQELKLDNKVQIYATDLDQAAIEAARTGRYPHNIAADVSAERLARFFAKTASGAFQVAKGIRDMVVFAVQNVIQDPPLSRMGLVCCRNLLIYLDARIQKKALGLFHYALNPKGLLFLGPSEGVAGLGDLFGERSKKWRIFVQKPAGKGLGLIEGAARLVPGLPWEPAGRAARGGGLPGRNLRELAERFILEKCSPPAVLVNQRGDILHIHGQTGKWLSPSPGEPSMNILRMARQDLRSELSTAIAAAVSGRKDVLRRGLAVKGQGRRRLDLAVRLVRAEAKDGMVLLVQFQGTPLDKAEKAPRKAAVPDAEGRRRVRELSAQLRAMQESLQATIEEYETANEELKSTNEELQSTNEELQSSNEELETAKEEMQSINEEQSTLNAELKTKIDELSAVHNDMANLLASTEIATLFLDNGLRIKSFTPAIGRILSLIAGDVGRPVGHIALRLRYDRLAQDVRRVLDTLVPRDIEVQGGDGSWHHMRIMPYRTLENVIDGVVVTFDDITVLKEAEQAAREARELAESIVNTVRAPLLVLDHELKVLGANRAFAKTFGIPVGEARGRRVLDLEQGRWNDPRLRGMLEDVVRKGNDFEGFELAQDWPASGPRRLRLDVRRLRGLGPDLGAPRILVAVSGVAREEGQEGDGHGSEG